MAKTLVIINEKQYIVKINRPGDAAPKAWQVDAYLNQEYKGQFTNYSGTKDDALKRAVVYLKELGELPQYPGKEYRF